CICWSQKVTEIKEERRDESMEAVAVSDYEAKTSRELSFRKGQRFRLIGKDEAGWLHAKIRHSTDGTGLTKWQVGWIPKGRLFVSARFFPHARKFSPLQIVTA